MTEDSFIQTLAKGRKSGKFGRISDFELTTIRAANALCETLRQMMPGSDGISLGYGAPIRELLYPFQNVRSKEAADVLREKGVPLLIELSQRSIPGERGDDHITFVMKLLCLTGTEAAAREVLRQARAGRGAADYLWSIVCSILSSEERVHPFRLLFCDGLRDPLPTQFLGVCYLDFCNSLARQEQNFKHPFDRPEGYERLSSFLTSSDPDEFSYAHSATAALPFLSRPHRDELFALAMDHASPMVQVEAAWASARAGSVGGIQMLRRFALDPNRAMVACRYLIELGREDAIPEESNDPNFHALAAMSEWLQHPNEFGRTPDEIEIFDTRRLYWPPTGDERQLWLIKYRFHKNGTDEDSAAAESGDASNPDDVGLGMVGSVTFALFGETTADLKPLEAYALHCCWELECNGDPRRPKERSIAAGLALLRDANESLQE